MNLWKANAGGDDMNIFTTENVEKYNTRGSTTGGGEYKLRNGYWAMDIRPAVFYQNYGTGDSRLLQEEFQPNTQYYFDIWLDADDCKYNGNYVPGGLTICYTDGTSDSSSLVFSGDGTGFKHRQCISNPDKSVQKLTVYYYTSTGMYYRADSFITPLANTTNISQQGVLTSGEFNEQITIPSDFSAKLGEGYVEVNKFIEW